jgi:hypothetical protein
MKNSITILILGISPLLGYSQVDKFDAAVIQLKELNYYVKDIDPFNTKSYQIADESEVNWINESIDYCNTLSSMDRKLDSIDLDKIVTVKLATVKSETEIEPGLYPSAQIVQVEFTDSLEALNNERILERLTFSEKECINKAPWEFWRINNKLYFILTRATIFGQEIPKIRAAMYEQLK